MLIYFYSLYYSGEFSYLAILLITTLNSFNILLYNFISFFYSLISNIFLIFFKSYLDYLAYIKLVSAV